MTIGPHPSRVVLHLRPGATDNEACEALVAIHSYFRHRSRQAREQLRQPFIGGGISLLIGLFERVAARVMETVESQRVGA
jgi:hypothetical protein